MPGHGLVHAVLSAGGLSSPSAFAVCSVLLIFCGVLRPLESRARALVGGPRTAERASTEAPIENPPERGRPGPSGTVPGPPESSPLTLNAVELALIAELSLEMARANDAVADDATERFDTRRSASEAASAWRQRARMLQSHARRQSSTPMGPHGRQFSASTYTGPERRRHMRRMHTRRTDSASAQLGRYDRRIEAERRGGDRRRSELGTSL